MSPQCSPETPRGKWQQDSSLWFPSDWALIGHLLNVSFKSFKLTWCLCIFNPQKSPWMPHHSTHHSTGSLTELPWHLRWSFKHLPETLHVRSTEILSTDASAVQKYLNAKIFKSNKTWHISNSRWCMCEHVCTLQSSTCQSRIIQTHQDICLAKWVDFNKQTSFYRTNPPHLWAQNVATATCARLWDDGMISGPLNSLDAPGDALAPSAVHCRWLALAWGVTAVQEVLGRLSSLLSRWFKCIPSGKCLRNYGKSPCLLGKSAISMAISNSYVTNYQRVSL